MAGVGYVIDDMFEEAQPFPPNLCTWVPFQKDYDCHTINIGASPRRWFNNRDNKC